MDPTLSSVKCETKRFYFVLYAVSKSQRALSCLKTQCAVHIYSVFTVRTIKWNQNGAYDAPNDFSMVSVDVETQAFWSWCWGKGILLGSFIHLGCGQFPGFFNRERCM